MESHMPESNNSVLSFISDIKCFTVAIWFKKNQIQSNDEIKIDFQQKACDKNLFNYEGSIFHISAAVSISHTQNTCAKRSDKTP